MNDVLADTHSIIWFLFDPARLSAVADSALTQASLSGNIYISTITLVEVRYLATKASFPYSGVSVKLFGLASDPTESLKVLPLTLEVAQAMDLVPRAEIPDMPDRIVAATGAFHKLPIVSVDSDVRGSVSLQAIVPVIW